MKVKLLDENCRLTKAYREDAGFDLYCRLDNDVYILPNAQMTIRTGVCAEIPQGSVGFVAGRSSSGKKGLLIHTGIIDCGYTGEISINVTNVSQKPIIIKKYQRLAQLLIMELNRAAQIFSIEYVEELDPSQRGNNGFGSSGI